jgi:hypothetical protein
LFQCNVVKKTNKNSARDIAMKREFSKATFSLDSAHLRFHHVTYILHICRMFLAIGFFDQWSAPSASVWVRKSRWSNSSLVLLEHQAGAIRRAGKHLGHIHACGCDRGTPGHDHIDWKSIAGALREIKYDGDIVLESVTLDVPRIARSAAIWRRTEPARDEIARDGLIFLKRVLKWLNFHPPRRWLQRPGRRLQPRRARLAKKASSGRRCGKGPRRGGFGRGRI